MDLSSRHHCFLEHYSKEHLKSKNKIVQNKCQIIFELFDTHRRMVKINTILFFFMYVCVTRIIL